MELKERKRKCSFYGGVAAIGCIVLAVIFKPVVRIWLQRDMVFQRGLIPLMAVYAIIYTWNSVYSQIGNGLSLMRFSVIIAVVQSVVNVIASILFGAVFEMGTVGILLGTVVAMLISAVGMPIYVNEYLSEV